jgi:hypothetical protein
MVSPLKLCRIIELYARIVKQWDKKSALQYLSKLNDPFLEKQISKIVTPKGFIKRNVRQIGLEKYVLSFKIFENFKSKTG